MVCGRRFFISAGLIAAGLAGKGQFLMDVYDTTNQMQVSGYVQPQFQYIQKKGASSYSGGNFPDESNNRFMLRRGRIRFDYSRVDANNNPFLHVVFQFDGTERGVFIRDFWTRVHENKWNLFSFTLGMFARPFGYEVNLSSSDRESPERGRMSQILMKTERDLGAMVSFSPKRKDHLLHRLQVDAGFFNGQGLTSPRDYDAFKDFIARAYIKPKSAARIGVSVGISYLNGGLLNTLDYAYSMHGDRHGKSFGPDSTSRNAGKKAPRKYYGADAQIRWKHLKGATELRGEYWQGKQTGFSYTSETPAELTPDPYYIRKFNGAFFYLLHSFTDHHQLGIKYDWYDPNSDVTGKEIGTPGANTSETDIRFNTLGFGYTNYINKNLKLLVWYENIRNERTSAADYTKDRDDNVLTVRLQYRF